MLSSQCFIVKNLVHKAQVRCLSRVGCLPKEQQKTFKKVCCFRNNTEGTKWITTTVQCKPVELILKSDNLLKNVYVGRFLSSPRSIHVSPTSYQISNQDKEKRRNYIFMGLIVLFVGTVIVFSFTMEDTADIVKVK